MERTDTHTATRRHGVIVLGMHRSGTSAMAGVLGKLGCALPVDLMGPGIGNPQGHWEPEGVVAANDRVLQRQASAWDDWTRIDHNSYGSDVQSVAVGDARAALRASFGDSPLFVVKDPRICRLVPLWLDAFEAEEVDPAIVLCIRHPAEVAASLAFRDGMERGYAQLLWLRHVLEAEAQTRGSERVICDFQQLKQGWSGLARRIEEHLGLALPPVTEEVRQEIEDFLWPEAQPAGADRAPVSCEVLPWAERAYAILHKWAYEGEDRADDAELDHLVHAFDGAANGLRGLFRPGSQLLGAGSGHAMREALALAEGDLAATKKRVQVALDLLAAAAAALKKHADLGSALHVELVAALQSHADLTPVERKRDEAPKQLFELHALVQTVEPTGEHLCPPAI